MNNKTKLILGALALLVIGAAYGNRIPGVKQAARALPKSQVL